MATPTYKGNAQPVTNGLFGGLGSWFSVATPAYAGGGQSSNGSSSWFGGSTPAYKTASVAPQDDDDDDDECDQPEQITIVIPRELVEPQT
jgi:hypothetical protein